MQIHTSHRMESGKCIKSTFRCKWFICSPKMYCVWKSRVWLSQLFDLIECVDLARWTLLCDGICAMLWVHVDGRFDFKIRKKIITSLFYEKYGFIFQRLIGSCHLFPFEKCECSLGTKYFLINSSIDCYVFDKFSRCSYIITMNDCT